MGYTTGTIALTGDQARNDASRGEIPRAHDRNRRAQVHRPVLARHAHLFVEKSDARVHQRFAVPRVRTRMADGERRNAANDELRMGLQRCIVQSTNAGRSGSQVVDKHIRSAEQSRQVRAPCGGIQIENEAALGAVADDETRFAPCDIAAGRFDLYHVGARLRQDSGSHLARPVDGQIEDADTGQDTDLH